MKNSFFIIGLSLFSLFASAQEKNISILGKVVDSSSQAVLAGASAFCPNTTYGTISNNNGLFFLRLPQGGYDLVISYTGYEKKIFRIDNNFVLTDTLLIVLKKEDKTMTEVAVVGSTEVPDGWAKYGAFFVENFIGNTPNADRCIIQNPEALRFYFYKKKNRLKVTAKEDLVVVNHALGYTIRYQLDSFSYDYTSKISQFTGYPLFSEIDTTDAVKTEYTKNRARTYLGSRLHFMRALYDSLVEEEGFIVEQLSKEGSEFKGTRVQNLYDSLHYANDSGSVVLDWNGSYRISYKPVLPDKRFLTQFKLPSNSRYQITVLDIANGFIIEENGYFYEQYDVVNTGYWAWKKLAELLPYDYEYE